MFILVVKIVIVNLECINSDKKQRLLIENRLWLSIFALFDRTSFKHDPEQKAIFGLSLILEMEIEI